MLMIGSMLSVCGFIGVIWIVIIAVQNDEIVMGVVSFFCFIVAIVYAVQNLEQCKIPLGLLALGLIGNVIAAVARGGG